MMWNGGKRKSLDQRLTLDQPRSLDQPRRLHQPHGVFENGAVTEAFGYPRNNLAHRSLAEEYMDRIGEFSHPQAMRKAVIAALNAINPGQDQTDNIAAFDLEFAKIVDPNKIDLKGWDSAVSIHSPTNFESTIPGVDGLVVKIYLGDDRGPLATIVPPTGFINLHALQAFGAAVGGLLGIPNRGNIYDAFLVCTQTKKC